MSDFLRQTQMTLLARTLDVPAATLPTLDQLSADELRRLQRACSDALYDELGDRFERISRLASLVPAQLIARLAQAVLPPLVGGLAGGAIGIDHPTKAAEVLGHLTPEYMADCAPFLDPRAVAVLVAVMPPQPLVAAADVLLRRGDYATCAWYLESAPEALIRELEAGIEDDAGLLMGIAHVYSQARIAEITGVIPADRLARVLESHARRPAELELAAERVRQSL